MPAPSTRRALLASTALTTLVLASSMLAPIRPATALDGTWEATPATGDFNSGANWSTGNVPTGTATFDTSSTTNVTLTSSATLGEFVFTPGASNYSFTTTFQTLTFAGLGIVINGGSATFNMTGGMFVAMSFWNSSSAGTATITGSGLSFFGNSTAGFANITNDSTSLSNSATLGHATFNNQGSLVLFDTSTAGSAIIASYFDTSFYNSSSAGTATITNHSGGVTFSQSSTAANSIITNDNGATLSFQENSTAADATITNNGSMVVLNNATTGNATILNNAGGTVNYAGSTGPANDGRLSAGSIAGGGNYILGSNELTVGGNNSSTIVSGIISGTGSLVKTGTGTLTLSGLNTYTGATRLDAGTLAVNGSIATSSGLTVANGATLGGIGQLPGVVVNAGGMLAPGNSIGILTVNGNLQFGTGSTYQVEVSPTSADRTNVTGTANLTGATVNAVALPGSFRQQTYTILNATGGLGGTQFAGLDITGTFSDVRNPHLTYDLNNAYLVLDPSTLTLAPGASSNQANVAGGLNRAVVGGITPPAGFDTLLNMPSNTAGRALDQLSGHSNTPAQSGATQLGGSFLTMLSNRSGPGNGRGSAAPLGYAGERHSTPAAVREVFAAFESPDRPDMRWNVWGSGFGAGNKLSGDAATGSRDSSARAGAVAAGADYRFAPNTRAGFSLAGGTMSWSDGAGGGSADLMMAGVYGKHEIGPTYISAAASYANYWMSTTRTVTVAGLDQLGARFNAQSFGGRIEAGHRLPVPFLSARWTPYGAIQAQGFRTPAYAETASQGSNQFALSYAGRTATAFRAELGVHTDRTIAIENGGQLTLFGRTAYAHDVVSSASVTANFAALGTTSGFTVFGAKPSQNLMVSSTGAEWQLASGVSFMVRADTEWGERSRTWSGTGRIRYTW
ncbi:MULTISPECIES: autotransporter domain-containing protein [unclassified Bradyrhizobium]|uniref:autotransporter outer membrane beta-barrel domain-containing protein n=1 Tax=unclassified Bradyrhizobium TaxID=2631580 RepID=UPI0028E9BA33|nr:MULTISPECIES: autotransporter domain-containing protein [unclassified Bradyrhizobium]